MSSRTLQVPESAAAREQALIAEAREHARRRRRRLALTVIVCATLGTAGAIAWYEITGSHQQTDARASPPPIGPAGYVTGHLAACSGLLPQPGKPAPVTLGTVTVVRGTVTWKQTSPGTWQIRYPTGPIVAAERIENNYQQAFGFRLAPGHYALLGRYGDGYPGVPATSANIQVTVGKVTHVDLGNACK